MGEAGEKRDLLGLIAADNGLFDEAIVQFKKAIACNAQVGGYYNNLGHCYKTLEDYSEAVTAYQKGIDLNPEHLERQYNNQALAFIELGRIPEAIACFNKSIELIPDFAEAHYGLGSAYKLTGDFESAQAAYRQAIKVNPGYGDAYLELSHCCKYTSPDDSEVRTMQALLEEDKIPDSDKLFLCFSIGKVYDDCREYDMAFKYYQQGNALKRQEFNCNIDAFQEKTDKLISFFSKDFFEKKNKYGSSSDKPVFIVGMPRSGTSLVEQIVASHSQVFGAGELSKLPQIIKEIKTKEQFPESIGTLSERNLQKIASNYAQYINKLAHENVLRVTDKMPWNYEYLGLIYLLFPQARVIHCQRHPLDTCLSNYFQIFTQGNSYSYDLSDMGSMYRQYERLMNHWRDVLPIKMLEINYEEMISDYEDQSQKLIDFLDLEWEDSCLSFYKAKREVKTASMWQVRQPVYTSSSQRWKKYEKFLGPLKDSLQL